MAVAVMLVDLFFRRPVHGQGGLLPTEGRIPLHHSRVQREMDDGSWVLHVEPALPDQEGSKNERHTVGSEIDDAADGGGGLLGHYFYEKLGLFRLFLS